MGKEQSRADGELCGAALLNCTRKQRIYVSVCVSMCVCACVSRVCVCVCLVSVFVRVLYGVFVSARCECLCECVCCKCVFHCLQCVSEHEKEISIHIIYTLYIDTIIYVHIIILIRRNNAKGATVTKVREALTVLSKAAVMSRAPVNTYPPNTAQLTTPPPLTQTPEVDPSQYTRSSTPATTHSLY